MGKTRTNNKIYATREQKPTDKAIRIIMSIAMEKKINMYKPFDLYLITSELQKRTLKTERVTSRMESTLEILEVIKYIRNKHLF